MGPDFEGIVFHPTGLWVDLPVLLLIHRDDIATVVEQNATGAGSSLVYGGDIFLHSVLRSEFSTTKARRFK
jgi:hypothetical protein